MFEEQQYCSDCGAKVIRNRLTLNTIFEHLGETFFNYDNKLLKTFIDLFRAPEVVIGSYIDGVRKKHVNPISYFGLAVTVSGLYILIVNKFFPEAMDYSMFNAPGQEEFQKKKCRFCTGVYVYFYDALRAYLCPYGEDYVYWQ